MPRLAIGLEYDGTDFVGWQAQRNGRSVQSALAVAVSEVAAEQVTVHAAGRTDAGVHAKQQVVHFDTQARRAPHQWLLGINSNLPEDIAAHWVKDVEPDFDARRSALSRRYRYSIFQGSTRPALSRREVWWLHEELDPSLMTAAACRWLGEHDFSAFRAANCQSRSPMRRITAIEIRRSEWLLQLDFTANAFLYHMVRNLVGVLVEIGRAKVPSAWAGELLAGRDRTKGAATAPASGLTLMKVSYPDRFELPYP